MILMAVSAFMDTSYQGVRGEKISAGRACGKWPIEMLLNISVIRGLSEEIWNMKTKKFESVSKTKVVISAWVYGWDAYPYIPALARFIHCLL